MEVLKTESGKQVVSAFKISNTNLGNWLRFLEGPHPSKRGLLHRSVHPKANAWQRAAQRQSLHFLLFRKINQRMQIYLQKGEDVKFPKGPKVLTLSFESAKGGAYTLRQSRKV